ncbi:MAG: hypothetical protein Q9170_005844 [Blastenia crenularia]
MYSEADEKGSDSSAKSGHELHMETATERDIDNDPVYSYAEQRSIIHRIDLRLVVTCGLLYCFSLIDRGNLGNASIAGMTKELSLNVGFRYVVDRGPSLLSNLRIVPSSRHRTDSQAGATHILGNDSAAMGCNGNSMVTFCRCTVGRFVVTQLIQGFGFVKKWTDMIGLRVVLGILEAGLYPSIVFLLATWYSRYDVGKRFSAFYIIGCIANAFGGILAYGLMQMDGLSGKTGWRWIFIIEGVVTCAASFLAYFALVDFPEKADRSWKFLNKDERDFIVRRINKDRDDAIPEPFSPIGSFVITVTTSISVFLPIILKVGMGFSTSQAQCLTAPPVRNTRSFFECLGPLTLPQYVLAALLMVFSAYLGDRHHTRGPILIFNSLISLVGLPLVGFVQAPGVRYFGIFLVTAGTNANIPTALAYQANNVRGQWKRAFCSALFVAFGGIGGIAGSTIFRTQDAPAYRPGIEAAIA